MEATFDLQGHRGARGLKPENTLPSFEAALDAGVDSIETDVHLTRDGVPVLTHDPLITERLCRLRLGSEALPPESRPRIIDLDLPHLHEYRADRNPNPQRFPTQDASVTPLAALYGAEHGFDPYAVPPLGHLFGFVDAYAGAPGARAGKTLAQRQAAQCLIFDVELKRVPFRPEWTGEPGLLEQRVLETIHGAGMVERCRVRSFDHRSVKLLRALEPRLTGAVLIADTAPIDPVRLVRDADARIYCPEFQFLDEVQVQQCHAEGIQVLPWTVNEPDDWRRLLDWGVDGITTDYPDRLAEVVRSLRGRDSGVGG
jgi:glycerophosphoryl diester phosphodiesterase